MTRIALLIEYCGKKFHGSQFQAGVRTVQADLEHAVSTYLRVQTRIHLSGRTDAGVHAKGQVGHFDYEGTELDLQRLGWALNGILKEDISVSAIQIVPQDFHARYKATKREYVYRLLNRPHRSALLRDLHYFIQTPLDVDAMVESSAMLAGQHDFTAFRSSNGDNASPICRVTRSEILRIAEGQLEFWISADHFVYNMVRIIVGTLIEVGLGKRTPESMRDALQKGERNLAGPTAPSLGLTLNAVQYPDSYKLFDQSSVLVSCPGERS